jgi:transcriptional regulator with XRE-family HTH domain
MPGKQNLAIERGNRLQSIRKKAGLTRIEFAQKTGVSPNTLKAIELGERELTPQKALLFSNLFSSLFAVSLGKDAHESRFDYLYYGKTQDHLDSKNIAYDDERLQNTINSFATNTAYMLLNIEDNMMSPFYNEGDIVCGKKITNKANFSYYHGQVCILEDMNGEKCLRRIVKSENHRVTAFILNTISNPNASLVEERSVSSIAQATWHWHLSEIVPCLTDV